MIRVRAGSDFLFRLHGIPLGTRTLPVVLPNNRTVFEEPVPGRLWHTRPEG